MRRPTRSRVTSMRRSSAACASSSGSARRSRTWSPERECHMFTLLGPAGVGKSRLTEEFLASAGESADVLRSRCLHYGEDITYWPLVEILLAIGVEPGRDHRRLARRHAARFPQADRGPGGRTTTDSGVGRHPVGRAGLPGPDRASRRLVARRSDPAALHRAARAPRAATGLGRRQAERDHDPPRGSVR